MRLWSLLIHHLVNIYSLYRPETQWKLNEVRWWAENSDQRAKPSWMQHETGNHTLQWSVHSYKECAAGKLHGRTRLVIYTQIGS